MSERGVKVYINTLEETPNNLFFEDRRIHEQLVASK